jgi:phage anti-repressor protein
MYFDGNGSTYTPTTALGISGQDLTVTTNFFDRIICKNQKSSGSGAAYGFNLLSNLMNCISTVNKYGFVNCNDLMHCDASGNTSTYAFGFDNCINLKMCKANSGIATSGTAYGFLSCTNIILCQANLNSSAGSSKDAIGFYQCFNVSLSVADGNISALGSSYGFRESSLVIGCQSINNTGSGVGDGFYLCTKMQQNKASGNKSNSYDSSYADSGSGHACADTADGGYNS